MSKSFRTILIVLLSLGVVVLLAYVGYLLYLRNAPSDDMELPEWAAKLSPDAKSGYIRRLGALQAARRLLAADRDKGIARLRAVIKEMEGTPEADEARVALGQALVEDPKTRPEALQLVTGIINGPRKDRRRLRCILLRGQWTADTDTGAAMKDFAELLTVGYESTVPGVHADARIALAGVYMRKGDPQRAINIYAPLLSTGLGQKSAAAAGIRNAIRVHVNALAKSGKWQELLAWSAATIKKFAAVPGFKNLLLYRQATAHRQLKHYATARLMLERLRRDVPAELLDAEVDLDAELAVLAKAETADGICRSPEAFLQAKKAGKESRAHFSGDIAVDTTWGADGAPLVLAGKATVKKGATLTVAPGARVGFLNGAQLIVEGALVAAGTADKPVHFTSAVSQADARSCFDGEGVEFTKGADAKGSRLEYAVFEHQRVGLACRAVPLAIRHCTFRRNGNTGLLITDGAEATVEDCTLEANDGTALKVEKSDVAIRRCRVENSGRTGVLLEGNSKPVLEANRIAGNGRRGLTCDNGASAIVRGNLIEANAGGGIYCNRLSEATIEGNIVRKNGGGGRGSGNGIQCERDSECQIVGNAVVENGNVGILLSNTDATVKNNRITNNRHYGIECSAAAPHIEGNLIRNNRSAGITCIESSQPTIRGNHIAYHDPSFIGNAGSLDVDAKGNYFEKGGKNATDDEVERGIFHHEDQSVLGTVHWKPRLQEPPPEPPMPELKNIP